MRLGDRVSASRRVYCSSNTATHVQCRVKTADAVQVDSNIWTLRHGEQGPPERPGAHWTCHLRLQHSASPKAHVQQQERQRRKVSSWYLRAQKQAQHTGRAAAMLVPAAVSVPVAVTTLYLSAPQQTHHSSCSHVCAYAHPVPALHSVNIHCNLRPFLHPYQVVLCLQRLQGLQLCR